MLFGKFLQQPQFSKHIHIQGGSVSQFIVGFGEALVDILPNGEVIGGAPLNFSIRSAELGERFGLRAAMVTRIGNDTRGKQIRQRLVAASVDCSAVQVDPVLPTGTVHVSIEAGQPTYNITEGVAWDEITFDTAVQAQALQSAAICYGSLAQRSPTSAASLRNLLDSAPRAIKVFDINLRRPWPPLETIRWSLQQADILKCNIDELRELRTWFSKANCHSEREIADHLQSLFDLQAIFWTRGEQGCCWQTGGQIVEAPVPKFEPSPNADAVGAGDAASAALVIGLVAAWSPQRIVSTANLCGAFVASQPGATQPLPREAIDAIVEQLSSTVPGERFPASIRASARNS